MKLDDLIQTTEITIKGRVGTRLLTFDLVEELEFSFETLNEELKTQARKSALVESMYSNLSKDISILEVELKSYTSGLWIKLKNTLMDKAGKPLSDTRITKAVDADAEVEKKTKRIIEQEYKLKELKNAVNRFKDRKDLLQTFASNVRNSQ